MTLPRTLEPWAVSPMAAAVLVWSIAWAIAAGLAAVAVIERLTASSLFGLMITTTSAVLGLRFARATLIARGDAALDPPDGPPEGFGRRIVGWFAAIAWSAFGVAWNVAIFSGIGRMACGGHGFTIAVLLLWSVVGLVPLSVTMVSIQLCARAIFRVGPGQRRTSTIDPEGR